MAKVIQVGNDQAVLLPEEFQVNCDEVQIRRQGDEIVLHARPAKLAALRLLSELPEFERDDHPLRERN